MNKISKIIKYIRRKTPRIRNSVGCNPLNLTIPRRLIFSGHFHLNTTFFLGGRLQVAVCN